MCHCGRSETCEKCKKCTSEMEKNMNCDNCSVKWLHDSRYGDDNE